MLSSPWTSALADLAGILRGSGRSILSAMSVFCGEEGLGVLAALADALAVIGEPGARFLDDAGLDAQIDQFAGLGDAHAIHDVELDLLEGRARPCS